MSPSATHRPPSIKAQQREILARARKEMEATKQKEFFAMLARARLPMPELEYRFHPERLWRFDYAWVTPMIALEVEGGVWTEGRHTRGSGFLADVEKYNAATVLGWGLLRTTPDRLTGRVMEESLRKVLKASR